jgi:hypothetical protein
MMGWVVPFRGGGGQLCDPHIGDDPHEDLAKFCYKLNMNVNF